MPKSSQTIRQAWARLPTPRPDQGFSTFHVEGSNAWVFKSDRGGFGLLLTGVSAPSGVPDLKNLRLSYRPEKLVTTGAKERRVTRCLEVELDPSCNQETLARVLDRLVEEQPNGVYSSALLVKTLNDVIKVVQAAPADAPREEVIGVWGELHFLLQLLKRGRGHMVQLRLLNGWESQGENRDIIDFRFPHAALAVEVKTTVGQRLHHFQGYRQVEVPSTLDYGYVASLAVQETDSRSGLTCEALVDLILQTATGMPAERKAFQQTLEAKLAIRGKACRDTAMRFTAGPETLALLHMADVPRPVTSALVTEVEWTADVSKCVPERDTERILDRIAT